MLESADFPFHLKRSECLDAFAVLEKSIGNFLTLFAGAPSTEAMGHKIEKARAVRPNPRLSKQAVTSLKPLLDRCAVLNEIRNDLVHSQMWIVTVGNHKRACFATTSQKRAHGETACLFTLEGLDQFSAEARSLAGQIQKIVLNPASSPRPPARGAAGGP